MRIADVSGRATIMVGAVVVDVASASDGRFRSDPAGVYEVWDELTSWAASLDAERLAAAGGGAAPDASLGAPSPAPRQVFAVGLNDEDHASEAGLTVPVDLPPTFTEFPTSISAPHAGVRLPSDQVDWEVERMRPAG